MGSTKFCGCGTLTRAKVRSLRKVCANKHSMSANENFFPASRGFFDSEPVYPRVFPKISPYLYQRRGRYMGEKNAIRSSGRSHRTSICDPRGRGRGSRENHEGQLPCNGPGGTLWHRVVVGPQMTIWDDAQVCMCSGTDANR